MGSNHTRPIITINPHMHCMQHRTHTALWRRLERLLAAPPHRTSRSRSLLSAALARYYTASCVAVLEPVPCLYPRPLRFVAGTFESYQYIGKDTTLDAVASFFDAWHIPVTINTSMEVAPDVNLMDPA